MSVPHAVRSGLGYLSLTWCLVGARHIGLNGYILGHWRGLSPLTGLFTGVLGLITLLRIDCSTN